jgi:hypothetical protein
MKSIVFLIQLKKWKSASASRSSQKAKLNIFQKKHTLFDKKQAMLMINLIKIKQIQNKKKNILFIIYRKYI